jgi:uncharacterized membrane protein YjjP (DUF1212 family)
MPESEGTIAWRVQRLETELKEAEREIDALRAEADSRERGYWRAGVIFLGGVVMTLFGIIWTNLGTIFPGR